METLAKKSAIDRAGAALREVSQGYNADGFLQGPSKFVQGIFTAIDKVYIEFDWREGCPIVCA